MDIGAQPDASDTAEYAGAGDMSAGIDKGKRPAVPEVRTIPAPASAGQAAPVAPEQPAPKTPTAEKTTAPAKTSVPAKTGTLKIHQIIITAASPATSALASAKPAPSAMTLHYGKAAGRPSFFETPELEGRVSLLTKSDKSLGSLKEHCIKWNEADYMDTASSRKKKLVEASATGNPAAILAAKPIPIASELLSIQQRLHLLADATNVSVLLIHIPSPQKCRVFRIRTSEIFNYSLSFFQL
jgi:hypothetical protein